MLKHIPSPTPVPGSNFFLSILLDFPVCPRREVPFILPRDRAGIALLLRQEIRLFRYLKN
jgi:hypothetical protein